MVPPAGILDRLFGHRRTTCLLVSHELSWPGLLFGWPWTWHGPQISKRYTLADGEGGLLGHILLAGQLDNGRHADDLHHQRH